MPSDHLTIAVIGLGYVGLPLALEFGKRHATLGYDIDSDRIVELRQGRDSTREVSAEALAEPGRLSYTDRLEDIADCNVYIVTVPTPVDEAQRPDLGPLQAASRSVGSVLKAGDVVIFESTVYPGTIEEVCVPILERVSGLRFLGEATPLPTSPRTRGEEQDEGTSPRTRGEKPTDSHPPLAGEGARRAEGGTSGSFTVGYSPERINPGDSKNRLTTIVKVTSGSTPETADFVDALYASIITAGTHKAPSIKVAEAAKVIENTQRDVNIALMNELAMIFDKMGIDTRDVLAAAGTKWNFLPFHPGLVGGHCIGVDPYYLTHKATVLGYHPELTLAARRINDKVAIFVANQVLRLMAHRRIHVVGSRILVLGLTFKENCPDLRNTKVADLVRELKAVNARVDVHDPHADPHAARVELGIEPIASPEAGAYDAIILAVAHAEFADQGEQLIRAFAKPECVIYDIKGVLPRELVDGRL
ncbi:MAG TPA: nucleotide sugar dehydrogenase [Xanthomonadaceae bacterium]|nr:nucleotide sugar dehydrogenase [Xanthomonadaceae bacterium]